MCIQHRYQFEIQDKDIATIKLAPIFAPCNGNADSNFWLQSDCLFYFISQICVKSVSLTNIIEYILNEYLIGKEKRENYDLTITSYYALVIYCFLYNRNTIYKTAYKKLSNLPKFLLLKPLNRSKI